MTYPRPPVVRALFVCALLLAPPTARALDIDTMWEYADAAASEQRFRSALGAAQDDIRLELLTQIARTFSLRRRFSEAHALLDEVRQALPSAGPRPRVRYLLERGRTFNSSGDKASAKALFIEAWQLAATSTPPLDGLAVDAAHMLPIVVSGDEGAQWTARGIDLARRSTDAKARALLPALLNNHAWNLHDARRFADALPVFREAEAAWHATGRQPQGRIATWAVARCLRSLGEFEAALRLQFELERGYVQAGASDGYVFEEIAELLLALDRPAQARPYFKRAVDVLGQDAGLARREPARLQRLRDLAQE